MHSSTDQDRAPLLPSNVEVPGVLGVGLAKVVRLGTMLAQILDELRRSPTFDEACARFRPRHETAIRELAGALTADLQAELERVAP